MLRKDISAYTYSPFEIRRCLRTEDFWKYNIDSKSIENDTSNISTKFLNTMASVDSLGTHFIKNNKTFTNDTLYNALTIRRTNNILKDIFSFQTYSRNQEVKQLWDIIHSEQKDSYIFRTDIRSFFEALPFSKIIHDLMRHNLITKTIYFHLMNIYRQTSKDGFEGLPRGLPISSSLSEIALRGFDYKTRNLDGCFYYSRYVDDIVFISTKQIDNIENKIRDNLPFNLDLNAKKTFYEKIGTNREVEFLGYCFNLDNSEYSKMSRRKLDKIKSRIALSFVAYVKKDYDYHLLLDRLKFLSGNSILRMAGRKKPITVGIRYQYQLCSEKAIFPQLKELDTFFKRILSSRNYYVGRRLKQLLTTNQIKEISKLSFMSGYKQKITHSFKRERVARMKDAWRYA